MARYTKTAILLIIGVLMSLFTGCITTSEQSIQEKYESYIKKSKQLDEYKVVYSINYNIFVDLIKFDNVKTGIYKKQNKTKIAVEMNIMGQNLKIQNYNLDGNKISCTQGMLFSSSNDIECTRTNEGEMGMETLNNITDINNFFGTEDFLNISYKGTKKIVERDCDNFVIQYKNFTSINTLSTDSLGLSDSNAKETGDEAYIVNTCIDSKTGMPLELNISKFVHSELLEKDELVTIMSFKAVLFKTKVEDSVFDIPTTFSIEDSKCSDDGILVLLDMFDKYEGDSIKINYYDYYDEDKIVGTQTIKELPITQNKKKLLTFSTKNLSLVKKSYYSYDYEICLGDKCQKDSCYPSSVLDDEYYCFALGTDKDSCESKDSGMNCVFNNGYCQKFSCYNVQTESECKQESSCVWSNSSYFDEKGYCTEFQCYHLDDESSCNSHSDCKWDSVYDYCDLKSSGAYSYYGESKDLAIDSLDEDGTLWLENIGDKDIKVSNINIYKSPYSNQSLCSYDKQYKIESGDFEGIEITNCGLEYDEYYFVSVTWDDDQISKYILAE